MRFERELLKGTAQLAVLEMLSRGEMYGYELSKAISKQSADILTLGRGSLYPLLYNLEAKGLVASETRTADSCRERRYYRITDKGRGQLASRRKQWKLLTEGMSLVLGRPRTAMEAL
jgi:PadR family transcriptional regulator, regulatory protein PadR